MLDRLTDFLIPVLITLALIAGGYGVYRLVVWNIRPWECPWFSTLTRIYLATEAAERYGNRRAAAALPQLQLLLQKGTR